MVKIEDSVEILHLFLYDLTEKAQKEVLEFLEFKNKEEGNLDVIPLVVITKPEEI